MSKLQPTVDSLDQIKRDVGNHEHSFDKPFRGEIPTLNDNIETMWHMAEGSINGLLELVIGKNDDALFRHITIFLALCWLKDYRELDRRRNASDCINV